MPYKFFFSYSRRDAKGNPYLKEFHRRLALEVGQAAGVSAAVDEADIGFFDTEGIEPGEKWPDKLAGALQSSKVFVCLYSNGYFKSEWCGKEFEVFRSRVAAYTPPSGRPAPRLIIPVLWDRHARLPEPLPDAVADLQYTHADFGAKYEVEGLAYFMKLKSKANEAFVTRFIINLAEHIARQAQDHNLPALPGKPPAMKDVQSAFHPTPASPRTSPPVPAAAAVAQEEAAALPPDAEPPRIKGPSAAWYVYLAGRASDYSPVRKYRDCYGEDGFEWQPHLPPEKDKIIGVLTAKAAAARGLMAQVLSPSLNLIEHLRKAEDTNTVTVLVIDPWSVRVGKFNELMRSYDRERFDNCEVIIVWNDADGETPAQSAALKKELVEALGRNFRTVREVDRASVQSEKKFRQKLSAIIGAVQGRLKDKARAARRLPSNGGESFFNINGV